MKNNRCISEHLMTLCPCENYWHQFWCDGSDLRMMALEASYEPLITWKNINCCVMGPASKWWHWKHCASRWSHGKTSIVVWWVRPQSDGIGSIVRAADHTEKHQFRCDGSNLRMMALEVSCKPLIIWKVSHAKYTKWAKAKEVSRKKWVYASLHG